MKTLATLFVACLCLGATGPQTAAAADTADPAASGRMSPAYLE